MTSLKQTAPPGLRAAAFHHGPSAVIMFHKSPETGRAGVDLPSVDTAPKTLAPGDSASAGPAEPVVTA